MGAMRRTRGAAGEGTVYFASRLPKRTRLELKRYAKERRLSESAAAAQLLEEGLRMEHYPGIDFRWTPTGRKAHVTGTGLAAWEMHMILKSHGRNVEKVLRNYPHLTAAQIQAAAPYIEAHPDEVPSMDRPAFAKVVKV